MYSGKDLTVLSILVGLSQDIHNKGETMNEPLVDLSVINPRILLDIKYATSDNFVGKPVYSLAKAYLRKAVAHKLDRVQQALEKKGL